MKRQRVSERVAHKLGMEPNGTELPSTQAEWPEEQRGDAWEPRPSPRPEVRSPEEKPKPVPVCVPLISVQPEPVRWLWDLWLPGSALSILDGDPGLGKSTLCLDLTARITRGWAMPPGGGPDPERTPSGVILLSAEDSLKHTIRPRLDAAGADTSRVFHFGAVRIGEDERPPVLPWDLELLEDHVRRHQVKLIIVDPFLAFLGGEYDAHKDQDVRRGLKPLSELAERLDVVILLLRHLNKLNSGAALYRGGGSIAITGAARASLIVGRDPDHDKVHVLAMNKTNLGPMPRSLTYLLEPADLGVAKVAWTGETDLQATDIVLHPTGRSEGDRSEKDAEAIILEFMQRAGGQMIPKDFQEACEANDLSEQAVRRAKKELGIKTQKDRFGAGGWKVFLPEPEGAAETVF